MIAEGLSLIVVVTKDDGTLERITIDSIATFNAVKKRPGMEDRIYPAFGDRTGFEACAAFYGISREAADYLFDPDCYDGGLRIEPEDVIDRIETVMANDGKRPKEYGEDC